MKTTGRKMTRIVMVMFIAIGSLATATRFATSAPGEGAAQAVADIQKSAPALDPDDPKLAGHFTGRVLGPDGKPIRGARVFIVRKSDEPEGGVAKVRGETDADGRFAFDAPDMTYVDTDGLPARREGFLSATADGHAPDWHYVWNRHQALSKAAAKRGNQASFELHLATDDVPIHGRFLDGDGKPLVGARVRLTDLMVPPHRSLDAFLERERSRSVLGCFPGYERSLGQRAHLLPEVTIETRTDSEGRFAMAGLGRDRLAILTVSAPSVVETAVRVMTRDAPAVAVRLGDASELSLTIPAQIIRGARFTLQLERSRTISGVVRERDSGQPIPGMWVGAGREDYARDGIWRHKITTDAEGRFNVTGLNPDIAKWSLTATSPPGMPYQPASVTVEGDSPVVIECPRGIPYRLKLVDEQGGPVEADVSYYEVRPNPHAPKVFCLPSYNPLSEASRRADGIYEGFVLPGPGAILVKTPNILDYRPAHVDPQAFFAPDQVGKLTWEYGTPETIQTVMGATQQSDYAAIVLVKPAPDSPPLKLSATVARETPRRVSLVDPDGKSVVGVRTYGITSRLTDYEPPLRAASFPLTRLHPVSVRNIVFLEEDRKLIGFLPARGDGDAPYTVQMQPWAAVTGRLVDANGKALPIGDREGDWREPPMVTLLGAEWSPARGGKTDRQGRFRIDKLVPGHPYSGRIYRKVGHLTGGAFANVALRPGEVRDLGDIRIRPPLLAMSGTREGD